MTASVPHVVHVQSVVIVFLFHFMGAAWLELSGFKCSYVAWSHLTVVLTSLSSPCLGASKGSKSGTSLRWRCGGSHSTTEWGWPLQLCGVNATPFTFKWSPLQRLRGQSPQPYAYTYTQQRCGMQWFHLPHPYVQAHTHTCALQRTHTQPDTHY